MSDAKPRTSLRSYWHTLPKKKEQTPLKTRVRYNKAISVHRPSHGADENESGNPGHTHPGAYALLWGGGFYRESEKTKWAVVMSEFAPICIYLVISPLVSLIPLGVPFPFASNSSTYPEKLSAYECGFDPFGDARSRFDIRFYLVSILFIIPDPEVTFSFPWAVPPNKIDPFGSWSMMAFLLILTIGSLYEWKRGASDRE
ncbi:hypothetical protein L1987_88381 [Smallanthus sonchifolius]|nr:hypothetical protein L1987_88381 [Smallanthus sonchifolius]